MQGLAITFVGVLQLLGMWAAYMLGRHTELPKDKWPKGGLMKGGWQAWHIPLMVIVGAAAAITLFLPIFGGMGLGMGLGLGGLFGRRYGMGMGMGGMGMGSAQAMQARRMAMAGGGYGTGGYGAGGYGAGGYGMM